MSTVIDDRVVQMRFDNADFEKNTKQSMETLNQLSKSIDNVGSGGFSGLTDAVENISDKFSTLGIIGVTALQNITNKAVDAGLNLAKALTIDQPMAGFQKYSDKTSAVQTIMAAVDESDRGLAEYLDTGDAATKMGYVNEQLEKLNWFTDETSYNFVDMVDNIGKFTSAGVGLEDATNSMMGIATWAARSGANATQASRAMYNLSQSLGSGSIQLRDWMSVENANMATKEFKQLAIGVAEAMGALKEGEVTYKNFRDSLSDKWFTSDVLTATLSVYSSASDSIYEIVNATEASSEAMDKLHSSDLAVANIIDLLSKAYEEADGDIEKTTKLMEEQGFVMRDVDGTSLIETLSELGIEALKAAQECKTFNDVIEYTKDAASTGWLNIFEDIFGNYEEAKDVWTQLGEWAYNVFITPVEAVQDIFDEWNQNGGRIDLFGDGEGQLGALQRIGPALTAAFAPFKKILSELFGTFDSGDLKRITEGFNRLMTSVQNFFESDSYQNSILFRALISLAKLINKTFKIVKSALSIAFSYIKIIWNFVSPVFDAIEDKINKIGNSLVEFTKIIPESKQEIESFIQKVKTAFTEFDIKKALDPTKFKELAKQCLDGFKDGFKSDKLSEIKDSIVGFCTNVINWIKEKLGIHSPSTVTKELGENTAQGFADGLKEFGKKAIAALKIGFSKIKEFFSNLTWDDVTKVFNSALVLSLANFFKNLSKSMKPLSGFSSNITQIKDSIVGFFEDLGKKTDTLADQVKKIATSLLLLAVALLLMASINPERMDEVMADLVILLGGMVMAIDELVKIKGIEKLTIISKALPKLALGVAIMAVALLIVQKAISKLGSMDTADLAEGLFAIYFVFDQFEKVIDKLSKKEKDMAVVTAGLTAFVKAIKTFGVAMLLISASFFILSKIEFGSLLSSVGVVAFLLKSFIEVAQKTSGLESDLKSFSTSILIFAVALTALIIPLAVIGLIPFPILLGGLAAVVTILAAFVGVAKNISGVGDDLILFSTGILIFAIAMDVLTISLLALSAVKLESLAASVGALILIMGASFAALLGIEKLKLDPGKLAKFAASILLLAVALTAMAVPILIFSQIKFTTLLLGLAELAVAIAVFLGAAFLAEKVSAGLIVLSSTMLVFSVAVAILSAGLLVLSAAMAAIGVEILPFVAVFAAAVVLFIVELIAGIGMIATAILDNSAAIIEAVVAVLAVIIESVLQSLDILVIGVLDFLIRFLPQLSEKLDLLLPLVDDILTKLLDWVVGWGGTLAEKVIELVGNVLQGVADSLPTLQEKIQYLIDEGVKFLNGLLDSIANAFFDFVIGVINGAADLIRTRGPELKEAFHNLSSAIVGFFTGDPDNQTTIGDIGKNIIEGIASGITKWVDKAEDAVKGAVNKIKGWFTRKDGLAIDSPSKVTEEYGKYVDLGLAKGITEYTGSITKATEKMGEEELDAMSDAISKISDVTSDDFADGPVIRPVLDLSDVESEASRLDSMLSTDASVKMVAESAYDPNEYYDGSPRNNTLASLKEEFEDLLDRMQSMQVVLDSGELVGGIVNDMDKALGRNLVYAARGI